METKPGSGETENGTLAGSACERTGITTPELPAK